MGATIAGGEGPPGPPSERKGRRSVPTGCSVIALHFNHRLRGAAADADEAFCREVCAALGVQMVVGTADWPAGSTVSEARARDARFAFLGAAMRRAGARALILGHQRDDVVETMLLRLSRGSGSRGLAAPRPRQRMTDGTVRVRPLLDVTKAEIVSGLRAAGAEWCEDATNHGEAYFRNRLRGQVIPAWTESAPANLAEAVAQSRALLEEEDEALELWTDRVLPTDLAGPMPLAPLRDAPVAVARRALWRWLGAQELDGGLNRAAFNELLTAVRGGQTTRMSVGETGFLETSGAALRVVEAAVPVPAWPGAPLPVPGVLTLPDGAVLRVQVVLLDAAMRERICSGAFDDGKTVFLGLSMQPAEPLLVRYWKPGDRYVPLGSMHATKLQDQFINRQVARNLRHRLPLVVGATGEILWVPGLPPAHAARVQRETSVAVQLTYQPAEPLSGSPHGR
jgi:tRNA(Ile)-lysidine synthase